MAISDWSDLFPFTVYHAEFASRDAYGEKNYGSEAGYSARIINKQKLVRGADGQNVLSSGQVWLLGAPAIDVEDKITLPDNSTPPILATERFSDENGWHHTKVYFA
jgi:hypothetical protein